MRKRFVYADTYDSNLTSVDEVISVYPLSTILEWVKTHISSSKKKFSIHGDFIPIKDVVAQQQLQREERIVARTDPPILPEEVRVGERGEDFNEMFDV